MGHSTEQPALGVGLGGPVVAAQGGGDFAVFFIPLASSLEAGRALEKGGPPARRSWVLWGKRAGMAEQ